MKLTRSLAFIDLEATGADPATDRIVEIAVVILRVDGTTSERCNRVNPGRPIPAEATAIHGITDADVADKPLFKQYALALKCLLEDCDLCGFGIHNYDVPLLWEEFFRAGITWDLTGKQIIDAGSIFKKKEQRTLTAAVQFYCGKDHAEAHGALPDASATASVLDGQLARYPDLAEMSIEQLATFSRMGEMPRIDLAGALVRDAEGFAVYTHKRVRGVRLADDEGYAYWMLKQGFSQNTLFHVRAELERVRQMQEEYYRNAEVVR